MAPSVKRKDLTLKEKQQLLRRYDCLPKMSQRIAAAKLDISQPLLCKLLKQRDVIGNAIRENKNINVKRNRPGKDAEIETALKCWFTKVRPKDVRVNGKLMRRKAEEFAKKFGKNNFSATGGWLYRWKKREGICYNRTDGEGKDDDHTLAQAWLEEEWQKIISEYLPEDVYNADETGLYYRASPEQTNLFNSKKAKEYKTSKERLTVLCCVNMSGDKEQLLVVGKSKSSQCFKDVKALPVDYYESSNAWMTSAIFKKWLTQWDSKLDHNIVLLVDNCIAHKVCLSLKHIRIIFLPANTSLIQPCEQGIIRMVKAYYRNEMHARIFDMNQRNTSNELAKKITILDALHLLAMSWDELKSEMIKNCFRFGGFSEEPLETEETDFIQPPDMTADDFNSWLDIDKDIAVAAEMNEDNICELLKKLEQTEDLEDVADETIEDDVADETIYPPTNVEMRQALDVLRRGVQFRSTDFTQHYKYERFINSLLRTNI